MVNDSFGRQIDYLRISVTDKCNYRCLYCMPEEGVELLSHDSILRIEEIARFVGIVAGEGIKHVRITGGEPLVRRGIVDLIRLISGIDGIESISLTTNAALLAPKAAELRCAGVGAINISLDTLDPEQFAMLTRCGRLDDVLAGIDAAFEAGFDPVKVNCVAIRGLEQDFRGFAHMTMERPVHVRFIEFMPVGRQAGLHDAGWDESDVIAADELRAHIDALMAQEGIGAMMPVEADSAPAGHGPAAYYRIPGALGTIGFISSLSNHFCSQCNRLRLTADGFLRPCLFSDEEFDVKTPLRAGDADAVREVFLEAVRCKPDEHHHRVGTQRNMSKIGG